MEANEHWIFYLKLTKDLPREYIRLDQQFKKSNKSLIPITLKGLLECVSKRKAIHVLIVIKSRSELSYYHNKVTRILKYLMRAGNIHLYIASSFDSVNDPSVMKRNFYNFAKLPVDIDYFCYSVSSMIDIKVSPVNRWPGGKKPRMSLAA